MALSKKQQSQRCVAKFLTRPRLDSCSYSIVPFSYQRVITVSCKITGRIASPVPMIVLSVNNRHTNNYIALQVNVCNSEVTE